MKIFTKGHPFLKYLFTNLFLVSSLAIFLFLDSFSLFDAFLICPLHTLGIYCVTCGITRASHALLRLDLAAACRYHPGIFLLISLVLYYEISFLLVSLRGEELSLKKVKKWPFFAVATLFLVFFLVRNILLFCGIDLIGDFL